MEIMYQELCNFCLDTIWSKLYSASLVLSVPLKNFIISLCVMHIPQSGWRIFIEAINTEMELMTNVRAHHQQTRRSKPFIYRPSRAFSTLFLNHSFCQALTLHVSNYLSNHIFGFIANQLSYFLLSWIPS